MNMSSLTPKQKHVLDYVTEFIGEHGYSPTLQQIGKRLRVRSLSTIHKHLTTLRDKGLIARRENTQRGISLTAKTLEIPSRQVPVTGDVAPDGTLCENASGPSMIDVPPTLAGSEHAFALRIVGNPLPGSALQDDDFIVAHETSEGTGHDLVIAEIDGRTRLTAWPPALSDEGEANENAGPRVTVRAVVTGMLRTYAPTEA